MPNWCMNTLSIEGEREDLEKLVELTTKKLDFDRIVPMPEHQDGVFFVNGGLGQKEKEEYGKNNWYDWSVENWGTKWNTLPDEVKFDDFGDTLEFSFDTAWSPPLPIIDALMSRFPNLHFTLAYFEFGCMFGGEYGTDGEIRFSEEQMMVKDIQDWTDYYLERIEEELEEYTGDDWMALYYKSGNQEVIKLAEKSRKAVSE